MRESQYTNIRKQTQEDRMIRIKHKIQERKQKLILKRYIVEQNQSSSLQNTNNSQIEKVHQQKLKNRQAAQKSRQQKKKFVKQLQEQNRYLKAQISLLRYCKRCRSQLNNELIRQQQSTKISSKILNPSSYHEHLSQHDDHLEDQSSQFIRISTTNGQSSSIGMYLFVCMIVLGVFCMGIRTGQADNGFEPMKRDLQMSYENENIPRSQSLPTQPLSQSSNYNKFNQHVYYMNMKSTYSTSQLPILFPTHNYSNSIIPLLSTKSELISNNLLCFQQIINEQQTKKQQQHNLRSWQRYKNQQKSLILCSVPLVYKGTSEKIKILGTQVINIFTENDSNNAGNFNHVQHNGLYKISASVESIEEIGKNSHFIY